MPYVQRSSGKVCGIYANAQQGYAEEFLPDDNAEVVAYLNPTLTKAQLVAAYYAAKGKDPLLVQTVIDVIEDKAKTLAPTYGLTFEQAKAQFYATNKSYRECRIIKQGQVDIENAP